MRSDLLFRAQQAEGYSYPRLGPIVVEETEFTNLPHKGNFFYVSWYARAPCPILAVPNGVLTGDDCANPFLVGDWTYSLSLLMSQLSYYLIASLIFHSEIHISVYFSFSNHNPHDEFKIRVFFERRVVDTKQMADLWLKRNMALSLIYKGTQTSWI